jgi:hypothetical protein
VLFITVRRPVKGLGRWAYLVNMADPDGMDRVDVNMDALKSEIRRQLINQKVCDWCAIFWI